MSKTLRTDQLQKTTDRQGINYQGVLFKNLRGLIRFHYTATKDSNTLDSDNYTSAHTETWPEVLCFTAEVSFFFFFLFFSSKDLRDGATDREPF